MSVHSSVQVDHERVTELLERELAALNARTQGSAAMYRRAMRSLSGGVASSYQLRDPWPIYLVDGRGPRVRDVDGNEYWDFHNGFGSMVQGHAHPAIVEAVRERVELGTHFAAVTEDAIVVAEELQQRFGLAQWRFVNSGSEATMDAIRIAARQDRSRDDHEDLRLLPRPPRRRDGLDRRPLRRDRRPRGPRLAALRRRHPAGRRRPDDRRAVQRRAGDGAPHRAARARGPRARLRDHGGGDDEPRGRAARARLPRGGSRDHRPPRGAC